MIIRDKQTLKRCIKRIVKHAPIYETDFRFDIFNERIDPESMVYRCLGTKMQGWDKIYGGDVPFQEDRFSVFSALNLLDLPVMDIERAQTAWLSLTKEQTIEEILDAAYARHVLMAISKEARTHFDGQVRLSGVMSLTCDDFKVGRFGFDYKALYCDISDNILQNEVHDLRMDVYNKDHIRYCVLPLCIDCGCVLHVAIANEDDLGDLIDLIDHEPRLCVIATAVNGLMKKLLNASASRDRLLVQLTNLDWTSEALDQLGTRIQLYCSHSTSPEQLISRWANAKEHIWPMLYEKYLPLARSGYELSSEVIEQNVSQMMYGAIEALHHRAAIQ